MRAAIPIAAALLAALAGCASAPGRPAHVPVLSEVRAPQGTGGGPRSDERTLSTVQQDQTAAGLDVFRQLAADNGNLIMSPASLAAVLTMLLPAARGATAAAIAAVLHNMLPAARLAAAVGVLQAASPGAGPTLREDNSLWAQQGTLPSKSYLNLLAADFADGVHEVNFGANPDGARQEINTDVARQTDGIIGHLFPPGAIDPSTLLALVNTIYLHAAWQHPFDPERTSNRPFRLLDGGTVPVPMMSGQEGLLGYAAGAGWQAVQLPYVGGRLAMDILMPATGFAAFRAGLTGARLTLMLSGLKPTAVGLLLPRFTISSDENLNPTLTRLGMRSAFGPGADFSGLGLPGSAISGVYQDAYIQVGEKGTTTAAATGAAIAAAGEASRVTMTVDQPFVLLIRNTSTGQILFLGQVTRP